MPPKSIPLFLTIFAHKRIFVASFILYAFQKNLVKRKKCVLLPDSTHQNRNTADHGQSVGNRSIDDQIALWQQLTGHGMFAAVGQRPGFRTSRPDSVRWERDERPGDDEAVNSPPGGGGGGSRGWARSQTPEPTPDPSQEGNRSSSTILRWIKNGHYSATEAQRRRERVISNIRFFKLCVSVAERISLI